MKVAVFTSQAGEIKALLEAFKGAGFKVSVVSGSFDDFKEDFDLGLVYKYRYIFSGNFVSKRFLLNIHYSLLPKYRGPLPLVGQLLNGDPVGGITLHKVVEQVDAGPILRQFRFDISHLYNTAELNSFYVNKLNNEVTPWLVNVVKSGTIFDLKNYSTQQGTPSYAGFWLLKQGGPVEPLRLTAVELVNRVRALALDPGVWVKARVDSRLTRLFLRRVVAYSGSLLVKPNMLVFDKKIRRMILGTALGAVSVEEAVLEGKKVLKGEQWLSLKGRLAVLGGSRE